MFGDGVVLDDLRLWRTVFDVGLVAVLLYQLLMLLRGTRSAAVLIGVALLFGLFYLSQDSVLDLPTVNWVLDRFIGSVAVLLVVLFQDDIRRAFSNLLRSPWSAFAKGGGESAVISEVMRAATVMSQRGIGALIVIEREAPLSRFSEQGVRVDGRVGWQLLLSLFIPSHMNPTHDGAVIISEGRVTAAACFLPLAQGDDLPSQLGSRHRAALGLADETDAIVIVVSEETGQCGIAHLAQLDIDLRPNELRERLDTIIGTSDSARPTRRWRRRILPRGTLGKVGRVTGEFKFESIRASAKPTTTPQTTETPATPAEAEVSPVERVAQLAVVGVEQHEDSGASVEEAS